MIPQVAAKGWPEARSLVRLSDQLLSNDQAWIARRVENLYMDAKQNGTPRGDVRKVSLDIDADKLACLVEAATWTSPCVPIPLGWMKKGLTLDLSVTLDGRPLSIWTRNEDSAMGQAAAWAGLPEPARPDLSPELAAALYRICYEMPRAADFEWHGPQRSQGMAPLWLRQVPGGCWDEFVRCLCHEEFRARLCLLTVNYMPIVEIPLPAGADRQCDPIVKFTIMTGPEPLKTHLVPTPEAGRSAGAVKRSPADLSGLVEFRIARAMDAQREHFQIHLSDEFELTSTPVIAVAEGTTEEQITAIAKGALFLVGEDTVAIYRSHGDDRHHHGSREAGPRNPHHDLDYSILFTVRPRIDGFTSRSLAAFVGAALLLLIVILGFFANAHQLPLQAPLVGAAQLIPSLASGYVGWRFRDEVAQELVAPMRRLAWAAFASSAVAAVATTLATVSVLQWWVFGVWCAAWVIQAAAIGYLGAITLAVAKSRQRVREAFGQTRQLDYMVL